MQSPLSHRALSRPIGYVSCYRAARLLSSKPNAPTSTAASAPSPRELAETARTRIARDWTSQATWKNKFIARWRAGDDMNSLLSVSRQKATPFARGASPALQSDAGDMNLNPRYISRHLMRERATKSLAEVLPQVESFMAHGFRPTEYTLSVLVGRDVLDVHAMLDVSRLLRVHPNTVVWSQLMNNALRARGPLSAMDVYKAASRVNSSAVQNVAKALINRTPFYRPDAQALSTVSNMFRRQFGEDNPEDDSRYELLNLISALRGTHAVSNSRQETEFFLDQLTLDGTRLHDTPAVGHAIDRLYRADSFESAVDVVWNVENIGSVPYDDMLALLARIAALCFPQRSTMPAASVLHYREKIHAAGDELDARPFMIALQSYSAAGIQLDIAEEATALGHARDTHVAFALGDTSFIEARLRDTHGLPDVRVVSALARAYSALGAFDDALRLWYEYTGRPSAPLVQVMLSGCRRHGRLDIARTLLSEAQLRGCPPDARMLAVWAETLADLGAPEEAVSTFERFCAHGGPDSEMAASAVRVLRWVSGARGGGSEFRDRMFVATPETWTHPRIMEDYDLNFDQRRRRTTQKLLRSLSEVIPKGT